MNLGEQTIDWLVSEFRKIPGMTVRTESFDLQRWQPSPQNPDGPGRTLEQAARTYYAIENTLGLDKPGDLDKALEKGIVSSKNLLDRKSVV